MFVAPQSNSVVVNFGWQNNGIPSGWKNLQSIQLNLTQSNESYKVYLSGSTAGKIKQLYLTRLHDQKPSPSLELTVDGLRSITLQSGKQHPPLEMEWPQSIKTGQTYSLIVKSDAQSCKASLVEGVIQADTLQGDVRTMRTALFTAVETAIFELMEEMEWNFMLNTLSIGIKIFAKTAIQKTIDQLSPQELEGLLRQIVSLRWSKNEGDARTQKKAIYCQSKMCLKFLGETKLKNIMRSHLLAHTDGEPSSFVSALIEGYADQFYLQLCIRYNLFPDYPPTTH